MPALAGCPAAIATPPIAAQEHFAIDPVHTRIAFSAADVANDIQAEATAIDSTTPGATPSQESHR